METTTIIFPTSNQEIEYTPEEVKTVLEYLQIEEFTGVNGDKVTYQEMPHGIFISTPGTSLSNKVLEESIEIHVRAACYDFFGDCGCGEYEENEEEPCNDIFCADTAALDRLKTAVADADEEYTYTLGGDEPFSANGEHGLVNTAEGYTVYAFIEEIDHVDLFTKDEWFEDGDVSWLDAGYAFINESINERLPEGFWISDDFLLFCPLPEDGTLYTRAEIKMLLVSAIWTAIRVDRADYYLSLMVDAHFKKAAAE